MAKLEEMILSSGLIYRGPDGPSYIEGSILSDSLVVRNSAGWVTHKIERSCSGSSDFVVRNVSTGLVEMKIAA